MRYFFSVIADRNSQVSADAEEMTRIDAFNDKIESAGQRIMAAGVASSESAIVFDNRDGEAHIVSGPAVESDLFMAGFWVIEARDDDTAHALALEASRACNRLIEVRRFLG
jgi:hypothetical protein